MIVHTHRSGYGAEVSFTFLSSYESLFVLLGLIIFVIMFDMQIASELRERLGDVESKV